MRELWREYNTWERVMIVVLSPFWMALLILGLIFMGLLQSCVIIGEVLKAIFACIPPHD